MADIKLLLFNEEILDILRYGYPNKPGPYAGEEKNVADGVSVADRHICHQPLAPENRKGERHTIQHTRGDLP